MFCAQCGNQMPDGSVHCSGCGTRLTSGAGLLPRVKLVRPRQPRMIAGVCSGIAIYYGWDVALLRILMTVVACLTLGTALMFYVAAWVLVPEAAYALPAKAGVGERTVF